MADTTATRRGAIGLTLATALAGAGLMAAGGARAAATEIAFGPDPKQRLDLFPRPGLKGAPMLMFVHGGAWKFGDKHAVHALPDFAQRHGLLLASAGYRMAPQVDAGGSAEDLASAAAWLMAHGAEYGGDPRRLYIMGHSAGAHLVALAGVDAKYLGAHGHKPSDLAGVIAVDGAGYDAEAQLDELKGHPMLQRAYKNAFRDHSAELSPTRLIRPGAAYPPFLIFYTDRPAAQKRSEELAGRLRAAGGKAAVYLARGKTHMQVNHELGVAGDPQGERVARFIATGEL